ncbi:AraC family transcriptional regulator [Chryseobacterium fluminis]|uniref:AraC family transcriptional regulator n=1 Tax=Chryseobacterium fluminis TaxID=2983606 RepID=UPI002251B480|nr:AraC family transcriptional regulator [Chryseobacterium sp. MMS21-Ot14]UZT96562.1 AraC family transcriptional regulator [Chryseobacterium sp. MMS21-Ot14]
MNKLENILREITPLSPEDSFLVFDRIKASFDFPYHYHPEIEINFISRGKGYRRLIGDHTGEIGDIELVLVGPNLPHCWANHTCKNKKTHEITVQFNQDFFNQSMMDKNILKPISKLMKDSIRGILFSVETAEKLKHSFFNLSKMNSFDSFIEIMRILNELAIAEDKTILSSYSIELETFADNDKMKIVHDFVHKNFENKITLHDAASLVNMSSVTFNRFIKKRTGKTFVNYLNEIRISYAARWLMEKNLTVFETAFEAGFNNIANFNKVFKSIKKTTPTEFKELFKGVKKIE